MADGAGQLDNLRRLLAEAEEKNLNAVDAILGAEATAAQAKRDIDGIFHRLHIREQELRQLKELLGFGLDTPLEEIARALPGRRSND